MPHRGIGHAHQSRAAARHTINIRAARAWPPTHRRIETVKAARRTQRKPPGRRPDNQETHRGRTRGSGDARTEVRLQRPYSKPAQSALRGWERETHALSALPGGLAAALNQARIGSLVACRRRALISRRPLFGHPGTRSQKRRCQCHTAYQPSCRSHRLLLGWERRNGRTPPALRGATQGACRIMTGL